VHSAPRPQQPDPSGLASWELEIAEYVVRDFLVRHQPPPKFEHEDLVQDVLIHWLARRDRYDRSRGASPKTFMRKVIKERLADIERRASAAKRGGHTVPLSIDTPIDDTERTLADIIIDDTVAADPQRVAELALLKSAIRRALPLLTDRQRRIVHALAAEVSVAEISRTLGLPRSSLHDEINRVRKVFRDEGLRDLLD
jgi:RNA polymerase sigma factor (sigma-70 family)